MAHKIEERKYFMWFCCLLQHVELQSYVQWQVQNIESVYELIYTLFCYITYIFRVENNEFGWTYRTYRPRSAMTASACTDPVLGLQRLAIHEHINEKNENDKDIYRSTRLNYNRNEANGIYLSNNIT